MLILFGYKLIIQDKLYLLMVKINSNMKFNIKPI